MIIRQAELCRQLVTDIAEHRVRLQEQCVDACTPVMPACIELPARVSLMGISAMPPISLDAFGCLAEYIDLHLQNRGAGECPTTFFAQTTLRSMCMSVIVACPRMRVVLPALVVLGLEARGFKTAWTSMVATELERCLAKSLDLSWSLSPRASVQVWSQS
jgi:Exodeoxyribonuclease V, gamma subunit